MNYELLRKIQGLSERNRKICLWLIVIILGFCLFIWWTQNFREQLKGFQEEEFMEGLNLPSFEEKLRELPQSEVEENLSELEEYLKKVEEPIPQ